MGNAAIIIRSVGCHQNGRSSDVEQLAKRFVDELAANGHTVLSASVETGGTSIQLAPVSPGSCQLRGFVAVTRDVPGTGTKAPNGEWSRMPIQQTALVPYEGDDEKWKIVDPDWPARCAYERYLEATGGLNFEGKQCPKWTELPAGVRAAWAAAVDPSKPRLVR